jgi:hypothetical protein
MGKARIIRLSVFLSVLAVHWALQFVAWSYAERGGTVRVLWNILATPLIHASGSLANQFFWVITFVNSLLWAAAITFAIARRG